MRARGSRHLSSIADEVLSEVERTDRVKAAELEAVRAATPRHHTEVGALMSKVAELLRQPQEPVTYDDLHSFLGGAR